MRCFLGLFVSAVLATAWPAPQEQKAWSAKVGEEPNAIIFSLLEDSLKGPEAIEIGNYLVKKVEGWTKGSPACAAKVELKISTRGSSIVQVFLRVTRTVREEGRTVIIPKETSTGFFKGSGKGSGTFDDHLKVLLERLSTFLDCKTP